MPKGVSYLNCTLEWQNCKYVSVNILKTMKTRWQNKNKIFGKQFKGILTYISTTNTLYLYILNKKEITFIKSVYKFKKVKIDSKVESKKITEIT